MAICASIFSVGINFYYAPVADHTYKTLLRNLIRNNPLQFIQPGRFIKDFPGYVIYANDAKGDELIGCRIWELDKQGRAKVSIQAEIGMLSYNDAEDQILLTLKRNGSAEISRGDDPEDLRKTLPVLRFEESTIKLPLNKIIGSLDNKKRKLSLMTFGELMDARDTWHRLPPDKITPEIAARDRMEVQLQIQKGFAMAFSIFSMRLFSITVSAERITSAGVESSYPSAFAMSSSSRKRVTLAGSGSKKRA